MDYYKRYMGDYGRDTGRLSLMEHGAYTLLLDDYYSRREPLPADLCALHRICRATTKQEQSAVDSVAKLFFPVGDDGLRHNWRADEEITKWNGLSSEAASSGKLGAEARWGKQKQKDTRSQRLSAARKIATHTDSEWRCLIAVCGNKCLRCNTPIDQLEGGVVCKDHVTPLYLGGSDGIENLQPLCRQCNTGKKSDATDLRPSDWMERLAKCMALATNDARRNEWRPPQKMHGGLPGSPDPDPNPEARSLNHSHVHDARARAPRNGSVSEVNRGEEGKGSDASPPDAFRMIQATYPRFSGRQDWITAQHHYHLLVDRDGIPWTDLTAAVERYAAFVAAGGVSGPQYVLTPAKFFSAADKPWQQDWDPPLTKAEAKRDANIDASLTWLADQEAQDATG